MEFCGAWQPAFTIQPDPFAANPGTMGGKINMSSDTSNTPTKKPNGSATGDGHVRQFGSFSETSNFLWSIADLPRGDCEQYDHGKDILPFTVLRQLDSVLADTKARVLAKPIEPKAHA